MCIKYSNHLFLPKLRPFFKNLEHCCLPTQKNAQNRAVNRRRWYYTHIRIGDLFRFISSSVIYSFLRTPLNEAHCLKPPPNKQGTAGRIDGDATSTRSTVLETPETWKVWAIFTLYCPCDLFGQLGMVQSFIYSSVELS